MCSASLDNAACFDFAQQACDALTEPGAYIAMQFASTALSKPGVARSKPGVALGRPLELQCLETVAGFDHVFPVAE